MRVRVVGAALAALVLVAVNAAAATAGPIRFDKAQYDSPGNDTGSNASLNKEWISLTNHGKGKKDLTGWTVRDPQGGSKFTFPSGFTLKPGKTVNLHTGKGTNSKTDLYWRQDSYVWNNTGDKAVLKNKQGTKQDTCKWGGGGGKVDCSPAPTPTQWSCTEAGYGAMCGPYSYSGITNSNGYNTYVGVDCWANPQCTSTLEANNPGEWQVTTREPAGNTGVRTYPDVQQLTTNWNGHGWNDCADFCTDTPIAGLASLTSTYTEVTPRGGTIAQFAWDIWTTNNSGYPHEIMVWVDNSERGDGGATQVGTATIAGQAWTIYQYGDGELIWSLGAPGSFAQQGSGTVDLLAILKESIRQGFTSPNATIGQINAGWEICSTGGIDAKFSLSRYTLTGASL